MRATVGSADGVPVAYEVRGHGSPVLVFVHGWSCDRSYWRGQVGYFADRAQVVTIDLAGHGESGTGRAAWTMRSFGADVGAVLDQLDLRAAVLVGHSMGGDVIVEAAGRRPDRIAGLVWVDVYRSLDEAAPQASPADFLAPFRTDFRTTTRDFVRRLCGPDPDPDLAEWVAADMSAAPPDVALDAMTRSLSNERAVVAALRQLTVPIIAINPDYRPTDAQGLARHGVQTVILPGTAHFLMLESPAAFNRLLEQAVRRILATPG